MALGIVPALAAWGLLMVETGLRVAGKSLYVVGIAPFGQSPAMHGVISLQQGFIFTSMILAAIGVALIERRFRTASLWSLAAALLSAVGIIHAYELTPGGVANRFGLLAAPEFFWAICCWRCSSPRRCTRSKGKAMLYQSKASVQAVSLPYTLDY